MYYFKLLSLSYYKIDFMVNLCSFWWWGHAMDGGKLLQKCQRLGICRFARVFFLIFLGLWRGIRFYGSSIVLEPSNAFWCVHSNLFCNVVLFSFLIKIVWFFSKKLASFFNKTVPKMLYACSILFINSIFSQSTEKRITVTFSFVYIKTWLRNTN